MTTTNDAPALPIRCSFCGDTRMITDRVDGEITCPECGYDAPAPAPSGSGVRVKALEFVDLSDCCIAHSPFGIYKVAMAGETANMFIARSELPKSFHATLDEAKAAAQADYEARILSSLASDASPRGEAERPIYIGRQTYGHLQDGMRLGSAYVSSEPFGSDPVALYAHPAPAPAPAEVVELVEAVKHLSAVSDGVWVQGVSDSEMALLSTAWKRVDAAIAALASPAPASETEGSRG